MAHTEDHNTGVMHPSDVPYPLCDVDPKSATLLCHWTRSCVVYDGSRCRNHSGAAQPYGKGAGPLQTTGEIGQGCRCSIQCFL